MITVGELKKALPQEMRNLEGEIAGLQGIVHSQRADIERLTARLKVARNIITDAQNFIHPTTVWRDTELMQRNIEKFLEAQP